MRKIKSKGNDFLTNYQNTTQKDTLQLNILITIEANERYPARFTVKYYITIKEQKVRITLFLIIEKDKKFFISNKTGKVSKKKSRQCYL